MLAFLNRLITNKYRDLFTVRLGAALILSQLGIVGVGAQALTPFISGFLGLVMELGVFKIDLSIDSLKEGMKLDEFMAHSKTAYEQAIKGKLTDEEKQKIRQDYLHAISKFSSL